MYLSIQKLLSLSYCMTIMTFIGNLDIFPLISTSDILSFKELTRILTPILKIKYRSVLFHIITFNADKNNNTHYH